MIDPSPHLGEEKIKGRLVAKVQSCWPVCLSVHRVLSTVDSSRIPTTRVRYFRHSNSELIYLRVYPISWFSNYLVLWTLLSLIFFKVPGSPTIQNNGKILWMSNPSNLLSGGGFLLHHHACNIPWSYVRRLHPSGWAGWKALCCTLTLPIIGKYHTYRYILYCYVIIVNPHSKFDAFLLDYQRALWSFLIIQIFTNIP